MSTPDLLSTAMIGILTKFSDNSILTCWNVDGRRMSDYNMAPVASKNTYYQRKKMSENSRGRVFIPEGNVYKLRAVEYDVIVSKG